MTDQLLPQYFNYIQPAYASRRKDWPVTHQILFELVSDLTDRKGLRQAWEEIDHQIQEEILAEWLEIIRGKFPK